MPIFEIKKVYNPADDNMFEVSLLKDIYGKDMTDTLEKEQNFQSHEQLKEYLAQKLNIPATHINILEI